MSYLRNQIQQTRLPTIVKTVFLCDIPLIIIGFWEQGFSASFGMGRHLYQLQTLITANRDIAQRNGFHYHNLTFMLNLIV